MKDSTSDNIKIMINVNRDQQVEIEEYCTNAGLNFSEYFLGMHKLIMQSIGWNRKKEFEVQKFQGTNKVQDWMEDAKKKLERVDSDMKEIKQSSEEIRKIDPENQKIATPRKKSGK